MKFTFNILLNLYFILSICGQEKTLNLTLKGNTFLETKIIDSISYTETFTDLKTLKKETQDITERLINVGYIDAHLVSFKKKATSLSYTGTIDIKSKYKYISILLPNNQDLKNYIRQTGLEINDSSIRIETAFAKALLEQLTQIASNNGNPFANFQLKKITKIKNNSLAANLYFVANKKRTLDNIVVKGYEQFPKTFLHRYAGVETKKNFNHEEILKQNNKINTLAFSKTTKDPEVLFRKDSTIVYFYIEKIISNRFDGFLGFTTNESNNLQLDGYIDLQLINNFNYGETFTLNYKSDGEDQSQLNTSITIPYLYKSPVGIEAKLALFRKDTTFSTTNQEVKMFYNISPTTKTSIGYLATQSENLQDNLTSSIKNTLDYFTSKVLISGSYNKTQSEYFFPTKTNISINSTLGNRTSKTNEKQEQLSIELKASTIIKLNQDNLFYIGGLAQTLESKDFLTNELYRFGGVTSIRGFEENSILANSLGYINSEYRYVFNQSLYVHSLIDIGIFENKIDNQALKLFSFGAGAGIRTKAGLLKIIVANGKNENQNFNLNNTKLHFQVAISF